MSYILDSLKKSQKPIANVDFSDQGLEQESTVKTSTNIGFKLLISLSLLSAFIIGYAGGHGIDVWRYKQENHKFDPQALLAKPEVEAEQTLSWPEGQAQIGVAQYFNNPQAFNEQQKAIKIAKAQKLQQQKQREIDAEKLAQKQALAEQVQQVIAAQGLVRSEPLPTIHKNTEVKDNTPALSLDHDELGGVSPALLEAFQSAIDEDNAGFTNETNEQPASITRSRQQEGTRQADKYASVKPLSQMPQWLQNAVPTLTFSLHMYSSQPESSWLRLNDKDYFTGEISREGLVIEQILPQKVILQYQGQQFSLKALSNW